MIGLIPIFFLMYLTVEFYKEKSEKLLIFDSYRKFIAQSNNINGLIEAMQDERKYSFDYSILKTGRQQLILQRLKTDSLRQLIVSSDDPSLTDIEKFIQLDKLQEVRNKIDSIAATPHYIMDHYTLWAVKLNLLNTIPPAQTPYLQDVYRELIAQKILSEMVTYLGVIRSNLYNILRTREHVQGTLMGTSGVYSIYKSFESELLAKTSAEIRKNYKMTVANTALHPTINYIDHVFKINDIDSTYAAAEWWKISDEGTKSLSALQNKFRKNVETEIYHLYDQEKTERSRMLLLLIIALLLAAIVLIYIVYIINRTLNKLRIAAEKLADGKTGIDLNFDSNDAMGSLAYSISRIDENHRKLAIAASEIGKGNFESDINPRSDDDLLANAIIRMKTDLELYSKKMESLVEVRTEELARSNEDLQQFAHVASHDLKEPLRKIATFSNLLNETQKDSISDRGRVYLEKIELASKRMSHMIEGVLAYSTLNLQGQSFERINLNAILEEVENDLELAIIQKGAKISYPELPDVTGIHVLVYQLFYNLISNSLKFSKDNVPPEITLSTEEVPRSGNQKNFVRIVLKDNGIGFNNEYSEKIFGIFSRLNAKEKYEGTGLGLALCRKIVLRHGGEISASSEEGTGSRFDFTLPKA